MRVARQVQQHLLDHRAVAQHARRPVGRSTSMRAPLLRACRRTSGSTASSSTSARTASRACSRRRTKSCTLLMTRPARSACSAMRCSGHCRSDAWPVPRRRHRAPCPAAGSATRSRSWRSPPAAGSARGSAARPSRRRWPAAPWPAAAPAAGATAPRRRRCSLMSSTALIQPVWRPAVDQRRLDDQHRRRFVLRCHFRNKHAHEDPLFV